MQPSVSSGMGEVAIDASGNVIVLFKQNQTRDFYARYYDFTTDTWHDPVNLSLGILDSYDMKLAMNSRGDAVAAWVQNSKIFARSKSGTCQRF